MGGRLKTSNRFLGHTPNASHSSLPLIEPSIAHASVAMSASLRGIAQLVVRLVWDQEVRSSSLRAPTKVKRSP